MNENTTPEPVTNEVTIPSDKVTVINIDEIKPNSVLLIKVDLPSQSHKMEVIPIFGKLFQPYKDKFREKNVTVMLMMATETIEIIPESETGTPKEAGGVSG